MPDGWMGSIAAQDQYQPLGNDPWTNTMTGTRPAPGQGFAPVQQSPVLYQTKAGPITEADIGTATEAAMGVSGGGLSTKGIKAYHSSPHDFDKFDLAKIGTGEGAQVYGHGLYFAENPAVSGQGGQYWNQFLNRFRGPESTAAVELKLSKFDREMAARNMSEEINRMIDAGESPGVIANRTKALQLLESGKPVGPRTYEVNINADPAHMLDWDKSLAVQHPQVTEAIRHAYKKAGVDVGDEFLRATDLAGHDAYGSIGRSISPGSGYKVSSPVTSQYLNEAGIPGIKYLDEGSRISSPGQIDLIRQNIAQREALLAKNPGNPTDTKWLAEYQDMLKRAENPTSNYVIFDPAKINILKKYGLAGAAPAGMGALAAQDNYQPEERM